MLFGGARAPRADTDGLINLGNTLLQPFQNVLIVIGLLMVVFMILFTVVKCVECTQSITCLSDDAFNAGDYAN